VQNLGPQEVGEANQRRIQEYEGACDTTRDLRTRDPADQVAEDHRDDTQQDRLDDLNKKSAPAYRHEPRQEPGVEGRPQRVGAPPRIAVQEGPGRSDIGVLVAPQHLLHRSVVQPQQSTMHDRDCSSQYEKAASSESIGAETTRAGHPPQDTTAQMSEV